MRAIVLRLEAPMMSFGGPMIDQNGITLPFPGRAMLAGLLGNAMGYEHGEPTKLARLQSRIEYGVRCDLEGETFVDYHTVDLGQDHLVGTGWTTRGVRQDRAGANSEGTHIRLRHYLADAIATVALTVQPTDDGPSLDDLRDALERPARPLFLGRKTCLPSSPIYLATVEAESLADALGEFPRSSRVQDRTMMRAFLPKATRSSRFTSVREWRLVDDRDWENQIHVGERVMLEGRLALGEMSS